MKHFSADHPHLDLKHTNIANAYRDLGNFDLALKHSNFSLSIYKKLLPPRHPQNAWALDCIGQTYEKMGHFQLALLVFRKSSCHLSSYITFNTLLSQQWSVTYSTCNISTQINPIYFILARAHTYMVLALYISNSIKVRQPENH